MTESTSTIRKLFKRLLALLLIFVLLVFGVSLTYLSDVLERFLFMEKRIEQLDQNIQELEHKINKTSADLTTMSEEVKTFAPYFLKINSSFDEVWNAYDAFYKEYRERLK